MFPAGSTSVSWPVKAIYSDHLHLLFVASGTKLLMMRNSLGLLFLEFESAVIWVDGFLFAAYFDLVLSGLVSEGLDHGVVFVH